MSSLNQIVYDIAESINEANNHNLKERLKLQFKEIVATLIRRDVERNGASVLYSTSITLALSKVDAKDDICEPGDCRILKSTTSIIKPVRLKKSTPFIFVGTTTGTEFIYTRWNDFKEMRYLKYIGNEIYYTVRNGYMYIYNNIRIKNVEVEAIYSDMDLLPICSSSQSCYSDDDEFPVPSDLIWAAKQEIIKGIRVKKDDEQIRINNEQERNI